MKQISKLAGFMFYWLVQYPLGTDVKYTAPGETDNAPKNVYREVIALFGLLLTTAIALTLSQLNAAAPPSPSVWIVFGGVAMLILLGMVVILRATGSEPAKHIYERGSIMFTRSFLVGSVALCVAVVCLARSGQLPGQNFTQTRALKLGMPGRYVLAEPKDQEGVVVPITISREEYPKGVPPQLRVEITSSDEVSRKWFIQEVEGLSDENGKEVPMDPPPFLKDEKKEEPQKRAMHLEGLKREGRYILKVYLQPRGGAKATVEDAIRVISSGVGMQVISLSKVQ